MDIVLNQVAIWRACGATKLNKRTSPAGTVVRSLSNPVYAKSAVPVIRYCKDYTIGSGKSTVSFCLFTRTEVENDDLVEKQLDDVAKTITKEQALRASANATMENFEYLPNVIGMEL